VLLGICATLLLGALASDPAAAASTSTPSLPGPPPQVGAGFPAPPAPGTVPVAGPAGPSSSIPTRVGGPGLLSGTARLSGRHLTLAIACRTNGRASVAAAAIHPGTLARAGYSCRKGHASAALTISAASAHRLTGLGSALARVTLGRGRATAQYSLTLESGTIAPSFWSDGGLECSLLGTDEPYLVAPDFTVTPAAVIDMRPWIAFYTAANGWRWLGTAGLNRSTWYRWTATSAGVMQWMTPTGALNPWTWAPINVHPGQRTYAVGVFELIYWYAHPRYVWRYAYSQLSPSSSGTYCRYP
jgi:hypothetical protein